MKKTFITLLLAFAGFCTVQAQGFEWAKGYSSTQENNHIIGTVTDSEGNLYIAGVFRNDATWDGERLLPIAPYGPHNNTDNTIIAKISPTGEMVWKKVIHSNNGQNNLPQDIKKVGDSAFACLVQMTVPCANNYTYYLDTLLPNWSDYPVQGMYMEIHICNAFIVFDFDGNVKEQHFLHLTYTDYNGEDIINYYNPQIDPTPWYSNHFYEQASFDIDSEGNIYISRRAMDRVAHGEDDYSVHEGTIRGIKFWVDRRLAGYYPITGGRPMEWYPQIVKFAPHFDTMLACRYVIQGQSDSMEYALLNTTTKVDADGNVYHISELDISGYYQDSTLIFGGHANILELDTVLGIQVAHSDFNVSVGFMVKYTPYLTPQYILNLKDSITGSILPTSSRAIFYGIDFDPDSSLGFISGFVQKNQNSTSIYTYGETALNIDNNDAFVLSFDINDGSYNACAVVPSTNTSNIGLNEDRGNLIAKNNRIFLQCQYYGGLELPTQTLHTPDNNPGLGLVIFDYSGNVIAGIDYSAFHSRNRPGAISLSDSVLYLADRLCSGASFGGIQVPAQNNLAIVAKYVDAAFMTPYVRPTPNNISTFDNPEMSVFPNPACNTMFISTEKQIKSVVATSLQGVKVPLSFNNNTVDISRLRAGVYILEIVTADNKMFNHKIVKK